MLGITGTLQQFPGAGQGDSGDVGAAEETGDFGSSLFAAQPADRGVTAVAVFIFCNLILMVAGRRNLRQMGDTEDLMALPQLGHFSAYDAGGDSTDAGIDFIEDHRTGGAGTVGETLEGQGDSGYFTSGGHGGQRFQLRAFVGAEEKFYDIRSFHRIELSSFAVCLPVGSGHQSERF